MHTDSTNYKSGEISEIIKTIYRVFLNDNGYVSGHSTDYNYDAIGGIVDSYDIVGASTTNTNVLVNISINRYRGTIEGNWGYRSSSRRNFFEPGR